MTPEIPCNRCGDKTPPSHIKTYSRTDEQVCPLCYDVLLMHEVSDSVNNPKAVFKFMAEFIKVHYS